MFSVMRNSGSPIGLMHLKRILDHSDTCSLLSQFSSSRTISSAGRCLVERLVVVMVGKLDALVEGVEDWFEEEWSDSL